MLSLYSVKKKYHYLTWKLISDVKINDIFTLNKASIIALLHGFQPTILLAHDAELVHSTELSHDTELGIAQSSTHSPQKKGTVKTNTAQTSTSQKSNKQTSVAQTNKEQSPYWLDNLHTAITESVFSSAMWFDSFFIDENKNDLQKPITSARVRLSWLPQRHQFGKFKARFRVKAKLPNLKDKVSIILSDDIEDERHKLPLNIDRKNITNINDDVALAVNYTQQNQKNNTISHRVGLSRGTIFFRSRYQKTFEINENQNLLIEPSLYYFLNNNIEAKLFIEYNKRLTQQSIFRTIHSVRKSSKKSDVLWQQGWYIFTKLDDKTAAAWQIQMEGYHHHKLFEVDKYSLSYLYRFNALREWLFFEVTPFIEFAADDNYHANPGMALRVEGLFKK